ncbi:MAG: DUF2510 domain-containing protein [Microlunatus sp.]|nr:DUF2510 domain-containing protein [Microlunatus sp.]MDN5770309.1 DUF2510 domain-containing protein [Microlunatus sp.]MDN5803273.1 DUF2510 domain-containing protein [Microlunatus sp.]
MTTTPRPGWYPDPAEDAGYRWWDGTAWTEETADHAYAPSPGGGTSASAPRPPSAMVRVVAWTLVVALVLATAAGALLLLWPNPQAGTVDRPDTTEARAGGQLDERARRASIAGVTMDLPGPPYEVSKSTHRVPGVLDVVFIAEAPIHLRTAQHPGWTAMTCLASVDERIAGDDDLDEGAEATLAGLATKLYGSAPSTIADVEVSDHAVDGHPGVLVTARVHYEIAGLSSRYDDVTAVVVRLDDGSVVVALNSVPDDASEPVRTLAAKSLASLRIN